MRFRSLWSRLLGLWALCLMGCVAVGALLIDISAQTRATQVERGAAITARACSLLRERYDFYVAGWQGPVPPLTDVGLRRDLAAATMMALVAQPGVEGGVWQAEAGSLAYAYPTYTGEGPKTDVPAAELGRIRAANEQALHDEQPVLRHYPSDPQTLLLAACPLSGPISGLTGWTMLRVQTTSDADRLRLGLGLLLALMLLLSGAVAWLLLSWSRQVRQIEAALAPSPAGPMVDLPQLDLTGEPGLDRIVAALNRTATRLHVARQEAEALTVRVAAAEKLAALGRVAAGIAHEIRNPIAAMRLRAENALASDDPARGRRALHSVLEQVERLDRLSGELLTMTQRREPRPELVSLPALLAAAADGHREQAALKCVSLVHDGEGTASLDPVLVRRALDSLLDNAIRHTPPGGTVALRAGSDDRTVKLVVEDTGSGVDPAVRDTLFEPFVTSRPEGTGLGLAIARELVVAQGGSLHLDPSGFGQGQTSSGARFVVELPRTSREA